MPRCLTLALLTLLGSSLTATEAWIPVAPAAISPSAESALTPTAESIQALWSQTYLPVDFASNDAIRADAIAALDAAKAFATANPDSPSAQVALAETATRAAYVAGVETTMPDAFIAMTARKKAHKLGADADALALLDARQQLYLPGIMGGNVAKAAAVFEQLHKAEPGQGWNAFFCGEAYRQMHKKSKARKWYQAALDLDPQNRAFKHGLERLH